MAQPLLTPRDAQQAVSRQAPGGALTIQRIGKRAKEADGSPSGDYCGHCYQGGGFTYSADIDSMIEGCAPYLARATGMRLDEAVSLMGAMLPNLKRWKEA